MQITTKILIATLLFLLLGMADISAQNTKQDNKKEVVEVNGVVDTVFLLSEGLWFEFKKRLNLVSEEELVEKKKKEYKVQVGKFGIEKTKAN